MEKNDMLARALGNLPFRRNVRAREFTTFRIGGPVTFFAEPKDADELCAMLSAARSCDYPVYIIGNGSNLLVSDSGVEALFIRIGARLQRRPSPRDLRGLNGQRVSRARSAVRLQ